MNAAKAALTAIPPDVLTLADYKRIAADHIAPPVWAWLQGGSGTGAALHANARAFDAYSVYNRVLVDCRQGSTATEIAGVDLSHPIMLAPIGYQRMVHREGEVATVRGALDTLSVISTLASTSLEAIAGAAAGPLWFQLYFHPTREATAALIARAEAAGCRALVVTLDVPVQPQSHVAQRAGFALTDAVKAVNIAHIAPGEPIAIGRGDSFIFQGAMAFAPTIEDVRWLRDQTRLPLFIKGLSHQNDARMMIDAGADGIVVSNHGGRALECAPPPLATLPAIRAALGSEMPILIDGGVRRGSDVFKALALGADAVMIGRPQLHALAVAGSLGVAHMLKLLREELELVMALAGCPTIASITRAALCPDGNVQC